MKIIVAINKYPNAMRRCASTLPGSGLKNPASVRAERVRRLRPGEALQLKEKHGGEVVVLTAAGARRPHIREALARA